MGLRSNRSPVLKAITLMGYVVIIKAFEIYRCIIPFTIYMNYIFISHLLSNRIKKLPVLL